MCVYTTITRYTQVFKGLVVLFLPVIIISKTLYLSLLNI